MGTDITDMSKHARAGRLTACFRLFPAHKNMRQGLPHIFSAVVLCMVPFAAFMDGFVYGTVMVTVRFL